MGRPCSVVREGVSERSPWGRASEDSRSTRWANERPLLCCSWDLAGPISSFRGEPAPKGREPDGQEENRFSRLDSRWSPASTPIAAGNDDKQRIPPLRCAQGRNDKQSCAANPVGKEKPLSNLDSRFRGSDVESGFLATPGTTRSGTGLGIGRGGGQARRAAAPEGQTD